MGRFSLVDYDNRNSLGSRIRARRHRLLVEKLNKRFGDKTEIVVGDFGGTESGWKTFPFEDAIPRLRINLINLQEQQVSDNERFSYTPVDLNKTFSQSFDLAYSNSLIEHLDNYDAYTGLANSMKLSTYYWCQTPNYWFPIEPHYMLPFVHFLPKPMQIHMAGWQMSPENRTMENKLRFYMNCQNLLNFRMMNHLFGEPIIRERFMLMTKSLIATNL